MWAFHLICDPSWRLGYTIVFQGQLGALHLSPLLKAKLKISSIYEHASEYQYFEYDQVGKHCKTIPYLLSLISFLTFWFSLQHQIYYYAVFFSLWWLVTEYSGLHWCHVTLVSCHTWTGSNQCLYHDHFSINFHFWISLNHHWLG